VNCPSCTHDPSWLEVGFQIFIVGLFFLFLIQTMGDLIGSIGRLFRRNDFIYAHQEIEEGPARRGTVNMEEENAGWVTAEYKRLGRNGN
jgi:hypothetical protein